MDTLQEALFKDMLNHGWFTESSGDVESPQGYFGYVVNERGEFNEVYGAFEDTINAYGNDHGFSTTAPDWGKQEEWIAANFNGVWEAHINSQGIIRIIKTGDYDRSKTQAFLGIDPGSRSFREAESNYSKRCEEYTKWADA